MELSRTPVPDPLVGHRLAGRYDVVARVASGGLATVYAAQQPPLGRRVAIKVLARELSRDPEACSRFEQEARVISRLNHPNIVSIFDLGAEDGREYVAMEFLDGYSLHDVIRREAPLSPSRAVRIMMYVTRALAAAHRQGVLHRDLKPECIMLVPVGGERDFVKLLDFGLTRLLHGDRRSRSSSGAPGPERRTRALASHNAIRAVPLYASPEHVNGEKVDPRSDLYALGVIAFEMLVGRVPFDGSSPIEVALQHMQAPRPSVRASLPGSPASPALDRMVQRLMAINPADRPADATRLLDLLEDLPEYTGPRARLATAVAVPGAQAMPPLAAVRRVPSPVVRDTVVDIPATPPPAEAEEKPPEMPMPGPFDPTLTMASTPGPRKPTERGRPQ